jgi:uncharacterized protein DUF4832/uncharacterized protein DUF4874
MRDTIGLSGKLGLMFIGWLLAGHVDFGTQRACADDQELQAVRYHGIRPTDPYGRVGLRNPERGLRIESVIAESTKRPFGPAHHVRDKVAPSYSEDWWLLDAKKYEPFGLTLVQAYCYLTEYCDGPIPQEKLDLLQTSLDNLRKNGLKAVLRFAYERDMQRTAGPDVQRVLQHLDQLEPIVRRNTDVIYVLQAGCIGAWGEWHSSTHIAGDDYAARAAIVKRLLKLLPKDRMTQVRVPKYKRLVLEQPVFDAFEEVTAEIAHSDRPAARIGFHNDGFLAGASDGGTWPEGPQFGNVGNPEFDYMTRESAYLPIDGELFWSDQGFDGKAKAGKGVDGFNAAVRMRLHHYSSFSLAHSYSEREGRNFSIDRWMSTPIDPKRLQESKMPISDGYFQDAFGQPVSRTRFEYIRDHLGYRLELQQATFPKQVPRGDKLPVEIELINRGFSTLHVPRPVCVVLIGSDGKVVEFKIPEANPLTWQPFDPQDAECQAIQHKIRAEIDLPAELSPDHYGLGLWLPDAYESLRLDPRYSIRLANRDTLWWTNDDDQYGVNLLGTVQVTP